MSFRSSDRGRPLSIAFVAALLNCILGTPIEAANGIVEGIDARIEQHRTSQVSLRLELSSGMPIPAGTAVHVEMKQQEFLFGGNFFRFDDIPNEAQRAAYREHFAQLFNYATLPFYWQFYEQQPDDTDVDNRRRVATWCRDHGIRCKGHPLMWVLEPEWAATHPEGAERVFSHVRRETAELQGLVDFWDVVNEPVVGANFARERHAVQLEAAYQRLGTTELIRRAFAQGRQGNPQATLVLNDFELNDKFVSVARDALSAGASIDAIGLQSHMHAGYWGADRIWSICEQFRPLNKPLHFTELTLVSGRTRIASDSEQHPENNHWNSTKDGELRQAQEVTELYRLLYSHPSVAAITWWDFTDWNSWMLAPAGLLSKEMRPKPAYRALQRLIRDQWWTKVDAQVGRQGEVALRGHHGTYEVRLQDGGGRRIGTFRLTRESPREITVTMERAR